MNCPQCNAPLGRILSCDSCGWFEANMRKRLKYTFPELDDSKPDLIFDWRSAKYRLSCEQVSKLYDYEAVIALPDGTYLKPGNWTLGADIDRVMNNLSGVTFGLDLIERDLRSYELENLVNAVKVRDRN